ncbi:ATP-dependent helicase [Clostridium botulinum]|nr:hypothetical protein KU40_17535 [Clostridium botulinum]MBY6780050.1 ATP-dependent helicase [Clostridium botulinum]MBY6853245.1 ATP-dependent helicase [Clostridium botulinum]NFF22690.1 ATP-dependent helicase [Clostridium botulinum]NFF36444.1 ATP-dependent helicase [Clostridium botulinum]
MDKKECIGDDHIDDHVDEEIKKCFEKKNKKSFFTFAGAGSGKTKSLVNILTYIEEMYGYELLTYSRQVAVITYTNAACEEILNRIDFKSVFAVSTIHSFLWELIKNQQRDIKKWVKKNTETEILDLESQQLRGRASATSDNRAKKIKSKKERLLKIDMVKNFSYNPNGNNFRYDYLSHAEVIKMGSEFIAKSDTMQNILINKYPILLIDESQDTKKELIDALLSLYERHKSEIVIGMFGDTMQKVYTDGKDDLALCIPDDWVKPVKVMNHRSSKRIIKLANEIRKSFDDKMQSSRSDAIEGNAYLFIADSKSDKSKIESLVADSMYELTNDDKWLEPTECKTLILEHHMAGSRLGFYELFKTLYSVNSLKTGILDGTLPEIQLFINKVLPLISAYKRGEKFQVAKIIKQYSPLVNKKAFGESTKEPLLCLNNAYQSVNKLCELWDDGKIPTCLEVIANIESSGLFEIPNRLQGIADIKSNENIDEITNSLITSFSSSFSQIEAYAAYVNDETAFATHQGVKGLEFPRVVVVMDDEEAQGFLFSYEKLFGAKEKTNTDMKNEREGKDTSIARTKRLFYVACTRAKQSLAIIAYTHDCNAVKQTAIENSWFLEKEITIL